MNNETYEEYLWKVKRDWYMIELVPKEMQTDEMIDAAIEQDVRAFWFIKDEKKKTFERCLEAVRGNGMLLGYVPEELKEMVKDEIDEEVRNG